MSEIRPQLGPQTAFLSSPADIVLYGGAAGGGKSFGLLLEAARNIEVPNFSAVIFRKTLADVKKPGSLLDTSFDLYSSIGGDLKLGRLEWEFPKGTKITFGHLDMERTVLDWQGAQIPLICFDELTHFSRKQFFYMLSRNRSLCGVRPYIRATTNPDSESWVAVLISWWIDQSTGLPIMERSGVIRYFVRVGDNLVWGDDADELRRLHPGSEPKSFTFIPAKLEDNAILMASDPGYRANLLALDNVERGRLLDGNWKIRPTSGMYFQRGWCEVVDAIPAGVIQWARGWDFAATEKTPTNDPDWTAGTRIGKYADGRYIVTDHVRLRGGPLEVERLVRNTASQDGFGVQIHIPQDGGQAGKAQVTNYARLLAGWPVFFKPVNGDKVTRFSAFSAQAKAGNVLVLRGRWNEDWFTSLEAFPPEGAGHDDDADATSEAFNALVRHAPLKAAPLRI